MTCATVNGNPDYPLNNNNVTNGKATGGFQNGNGVQLNGKVKVPLEVEDELGTRRSLIVLFSIFATSILAIAYIYKNFPELEE